MAGGGSGKGGGGSGLSDPSAVNTGGQSAWAQYRAGEQAGYAPTQDPFSYTGWEQTTPSSFASSGSAGSTQAVPVAQSEKTWADMLEGASKGATQWGQGGGGGLGGGGGVGSLSVPGFSMGTVRMGPLGFPLTPGQSKILERLGMPPGQAQSFIANQILSGNPAYGPYTAQQIAAARTMSASPGRSTPVAAAEEAD